MKVEEALHMVGGGGATSYASNSRLQRKTVLEMKPIVEEAISAICHTIHPKTLLVADLGCSSGPNAFLVMSEIINTVADSALPQLGACPVEIQFYLNDLPGNDFNALFRSLALYDEEVRMEMGEKVVPYYVVGVPGSFYGRLFPSRSVHFFHSSYSLHWLSQVPQGLENDRGVTQNKGNIYISKTSPPNVIKLYLEQFQRDFSAFLKLRCEEITLEGRMILSFLGRSLFPLGKEYCYPWELLAEALNDMVAEGLVEREKVNTFNLPTYAPSMEEVMAIIESEGSFRLEKAQSFESNWDPFDDSNEEFVLDNHLSGENVAKCIRAVAESMLAHHFGEIIIDDLFSRYAKNVARHLLKEKTKHTVFIISLKIKGY